MKFVNIRVAVAMVCLIFAVAAQAQEATNPAAATAPASSQTPSQTTVPHVIKFSGTLLDPLARPVAGPAGVTFALYAQQAGGAALWLETQNVKPDEKGNYNVLLGAESAHGVPEELFASGEARWLGIQPERQAELPRVLLVSVPYALKAADAETLGGLPASAFLTAPGQSGNAPASGSTLVITTPLAAQPLISTAALTGGGITKSIPIWTSATNLGNSNITQVGSIVSVNDMLQLPATGTATATATAGFNSQPFDLLASSWNSSTKVAVSEHFRWQAEPISNTSAPAGKLNLLFASGTGTPAETGLSINSKGQIAFASGQAFPTVTGNETVTGNVSASQLIATVANGTAPLKVTSTTMVPNLNANLLGGLSASAFATLGANIFSGPQSIAGKGLNIFMGDVGCGPPTAGIQASNVAANCLNFALGIDGSQNSTFINRPTGGAIHFKEGNVSDQMVISSGGKVGIGTTTPLGQLDVLATSDGGSGLMSRGAHSSLGLGGVGVTALGGDGNARFFFGGFGIEATGGANADGKHAPAGEFHGDVDIQGCLTVAGTVIGGTCSSDVRLKKNIQPFPAVLEKLTRLQPVSYYWKVDEYPQFRFASTRNTGLIAQEVEKVFPEMVSVDEAGYKRVNYGELPYLMLQAIRELKTQNDQLHTEMKVNEANWKNPQPRKRAQQLEARTRKQARELHEMQQQNTQLRQQLQAVLVEVKQIRNQVEAASAKTNGPAKDEASGTSALVSAATVASGNK